MSSFSWFSLLLLLAMAYLGSRFGWISQLIIYATFGLFVSASLLLFDGIQGVYRDSGVPDSFTGVTALLTLVIFSALLVIPALRLHTKYYQRKVEDEHYRQAGGIGLGLLIGLILIYFTGQSLVRYEFISYETESYDSVPIRIIRAISADNALN
ncbi:MAG: hypothetical protein VW440_06745 [Bordetella sp.]